MVLQSNGRHLAVAAGQSCLYLDRVQPAGKQVMDIAEFLRGHRVVEGDMFGDG
jgi:methionyl-tRNA formyltransferase